MTPPRQVPSRDDYYMGLAFWIASRSKDPSSQIGSVIVGSDNVPISSGYNGPPRKIDDNEMDWSRPPQNPEEIEKGHVYKYDGVFHSEINCIKYSKGADLKGSTLYVTGFPCRNCMLHIVGAEIGRVVYCQFKTTTGSMLSNDDEIKKSREIARMGGVVLQQFSGNLNWMRERMNTLENLGIFS